MRWTPWMLLLSAVLCVSSVREVCGGPPTWPPIGPTGGVITALVLDPTTPTTLYAGTVWAGRFKSTDSQEIMKKVGAMPLIHEEKGGDTEQVSLLPLERERVRAQQLFEALLRVAAIPPDIAVAFSILDKPNLIDSFFGGGCYEMALFTGHHKEIFQKPAISISSAALMLNSAREKPHLTAFLLAHEVAHLQKRLARKFYCSEEREISPEQRRQEELEADQRGVEFLNALGYDCYVR
jgi:hypothetical protein